MPIRYALYWCIYMKTYSPQASLLDGFAMSTIERKRTFWWKGWLPLYEVGVLIVWQTDERVKFESCWKKDLDALGICGNLQVTTKLRTLQ